MGNDSWIIFCIGGDDQRANNFRFAVSDHTSFCFGFSSSYTPVLLPSLYCFLSSYSKVVFLLAL